MSGGLSNKDKKKLALELYLNTDKNQKEICQLAGCSEPTFTKWKKAGKWEEQKGAYEITSSKIITRLYKKLDTLSQAETIDADKLIKVANTIEKLSDKNATVSQIINTFKDFTGWLFKEDPELAKRVNSLQKKYIDLKINGHI